MNKAVRIGCMLGILLLANGDAPAQDHHTLTGPNLLLEQTVAGMPRDEKQSVRVMTATFKPGDNTPRHTHRFPVMVYVVEGTFTLELNGREPLIARAGEAIVEPPNVEMVGYNRSTSELTRVVVVYVSTPDTPFFDPVH